MKTGKQLREREEKSFRLSKRRRKNRRKPREEKL